MAFSQSGLTACESPLNCVFIQKEFPNAEKTFIQLKKIAENIPRTSVIYQSKNYWKGVCRSLMFRFPDDLEILKVNKQTIQIKSSSRIGASDLGVNQRRVSYLLTTLANN